VQTNIYGKRSEIIAADYLKNKGYKILETNYKNKIGEIDIIAQDEDYLVFVEVKARLSQAFGHPFDAIDGRKQQKIRAVASIYLMKNKKYGTNCRFDAISILGIENPEITHIIDAFKKGYWLLPYYKI